MISCYYNTCGKLSYGALLGFTIGPEFSNFTCATLPFVRISIQRLLCKPPKETNDYSGRCATISYCVNTPFTVLTTVPTTPVSTCLHARDESAGYDCYLPVFHPRCIQRTALKCLRYDTNASIVAHFSKHRNPGRVWTMYDLRGAFKIVDNFLRCVENRFRQR